MSKLLGEFIEYLEGEVANGSIYVWGAQGQTGSTITESWIKKMETSTANANRAIAYWKRQVSAGYGSKLSAFDCSGLGVYWLYKKKLISSDISSHTMYTKCKKISKSELKRGDWVFRHNGVKVYHVGYVVDDALNVIECMGRDVGCVKRSLNASGSNYWNKFGRPEWLFPEEKDVVSPIINNKPYFSKCTGGSVNVRSGRGTSHNKIGMAHRDDLMLTLPAVGGWCEVAVVLDDKLQIGYMSATYLKAVER